MSRKPLSVQAQQDRLRRKRREAGEVLTIFRKPLKESLTSVLPITAIVLVLCFTITPISNNAMMAFLLGSLLLIVGMGLFTLGSEMSMIPLGEAVGKEITKSKKVWVIVAISFLIGVIITVAEPELQVLAGQVPSIPDRVIIWSVALGVGVFLVIALLRGMRLLPGWGVNLALTMVSVILGIVCMVNPFHTALALARMLGVALLLYAVMEAVGYVQLRKVGRAVEDAVNRTAPIIDENARVLDDQDESVK